LRRLHYVPKVNSEVLVIDERLSNFLLKCIPKHCEFTIVKNRGYIPYVRSISFFIKLVIFCTRFGLTSKSIMLAIIDELKPKVVITFIDNNVAAQGLNLVHPEIRFISIQNGVRTLRNITKLNKINFDSYYGFGLFEKESFLSKGGSFVNYYPSGSLKLGLFLSKYNYLPNKIKKNKTICFVSQYRSEALLHNNPSNTSVGDLLRDFVKISEDLYRQTVNYALLNDYTIHIAMTYNAGDSDYSAEKSYFQKIIASDVVKYFDNDLDEMTSYKVAIESDLIIGFDSTLLMEMFGCNKRVVWGLDSKFGFAKAWGLEAYPMYIPSELILVNLNKDSFNNKLNNLLLMNDEKYNNLTKKSREYFINSERPYVHETVKHDIDEYLSSNG